MIKIDVVYVEDVKFSFSNEKVSISPVESIARTWRISWETVARSEDLLNYLQSVLPTSENCIGKIVSIGCVIDQREVDYLLYSEVFFPERAIKFFSKINLKTFCFLVKCPDKREFEDLSFSVNIYMNGKDFNENAISDFMGLSGTRSKYCKIENSDWDYSSDRKAFAPGVKLSVEVRDLIKFLGNKLDSEHNPVSVKMDYGELCFRIDSFSDNTVTLTGKDFHVMSRHNFILSFWFLLKREGLTVVR